VPPLFVIIDLVRSRLALNLACMFICSAGRCRAPCRLDGQMQALAQGKSVLPSCGTGPRRRDRDRSRNRRRRFRYGERCSRLAPQRFLIKGPKPLNWDEVMGTLVQRTLLGVVPSPGSLRYIYPEVNSHRGCLAPPSYLSARILRSRSRCTNIAKVQSGSRQRFML
jgi:hypothetical protein